VGAGENVGAARAPLRSRPPTPPRLLDDDGEGPRHSVEDVVAEGEVGVGALGHFLGLTRHPPHLGQGGDLTCGRQGSVRRRFDAGAWSGVER